MDIGKPYMGKRKKYLIDPEKDDMLSVSENCTRAKQRKLVFKFTTNITKVNYEK